MTVIVQNTVANNLNNSANNSATSTNQQSQNNQQSANNLNKIKFVAEEEEVRPPHKPAHHGGYEVTPGHHGEEHHGEEHHAGHHHHGELAETGAPKTPVLLGLSAAFLAAGAAAMRLSRRRA